MALIRVLIQTPSCLSNTSAPGLRISSLQVLSSASTSSSRELLQQSARYSTCKASLTVLYSGNTRSFSSDAPSGGNNDGRVKAAWQFVVSVVKSFISGSRRIWSDTKMSRKLIKKMGDLQIQPTAPSTTSLPYAITPDELQLVYRTKADMLKMLPTLLFFCIPVLGYLVPFIAYFVFPKYMLSQHFWNDSQREKYESAAMKERQLSLLQLDKMMHDAAKNNRELTEVLNRAKLQMEQSSPSNGDWEWLKKHEASAAYWRLSSQQLTLLTQLWGVPTVLPFKWWKQRRLNNHLAYIYTTDWLLVSSKDHLDSKSTNEFALERCLLSTDKQDPVIFLREWVKFSTTFNHCPTSLIAHLPLLWFRK